MRAILALFGFLLLTGCAGLGEDFPNLNRYDWTIPHPEIDEFEIEE